MHATFPERNHRAAAVREVLAFPRPEGRRLTIGDRIDRLIPRGMKGPVPPNPALVAEPAVADGASPAGIKAVFGKAAGPHPFSFARLALTPGTDLYGTGECAGPLRRNGQRTICWNTDQFGYTDGGEPLYQSHPWVVGVRPDGTAFGVMAETTHRCEIDLGGAISFRADGPPFSLIVIERAGVAGVLSALAELTGRMPLPPQWALGYQQCRWSYHPDSRVREIARTFREKKLPCDVIWIDIDYMDGFRCFTFNNEEFPNPAALNDTLHAQGFRSVWMIDPGIKRDEAFSVYESGRLGDHFVRDQHGKEYHGHVWPGACAFPDFTRERTREWWSQLYAEFMAHGIDGVWNDMNEPAVFSQGDESDMRAWIQEKWKTMPLHNWHEADGELGGPGTHARYHNIYGMLMARATREGVAAANPDKRPFVLTRAGYLGSHRYAACWTGDNVSNWSHLAWSIPMALNLGLSGQPFTGPDIGGFAEDASPELFARWMGIGALLPFARAHAMKECVDHEPWSFGERAEATCRHALERRMRLLPFLYTLFHEAAVAGLPIARPLFMHDATDSRLRDADDSFMLGHDVLVRASHYPGAPTRCDAAFPKGDWAPFEPSPRADGTWDPELPRLFVRAGGIVPMGPVRQHVDEKPLDPLTLIVHPDAEGFAEGTLYEDAGEGFGFERGEYRISTYQLRVKRREKRAVLERTAVHGDFGAPARRIEVVLVGPRGVTASATGQDGQAVELVLPG